MRENRFDDTMYDTEDFELVAPESTLTVDAINKGMVTEIEINGKKFDVVNPEYAKELQRLMLDMSNKMKAMDRAMRNMSTSQRQQAKMISDLRTQLDGKVDRG